MGKYKFSKHAKLKFEILKEHGFPISKKQIIDTIKKADKKEKGKSNRYISQKPIDREHVLRVVYEKIDRKIVIITVNF